MMIETLLENPYVYYVWSLLHFKPRLSQIMEVVNQTYYPKILDLGCGPGLMSKYVKNCEYTGIDFNQEYIQFAKKHYKGRFIFGDIVKLKDHCSGEEFDYIVLNGVLHHINDGFAANLIDQAKLYLKLNGQIIVIDLVSNDLGKINKFLVNHDRGDFIRSKEQYYHLFSSNFNIKGYQEFTIGFGPIVLWKLARIVLTKKT